MSKHAVIALNLLTEKWVESRHWAHPATSLYPYDTRLFLSNDEMRMYASLLPRRNDVGEKDLAEALVKTRNALVREIERSPRIREIYRIANLSLPKVFSEFQEFISFCLKWEESLQNIRTA